MDKNTKDTKKLQEINRSLQKDSGLPEIPDINQQIRTLEVVKDEISSALLAAEKLTKTVNYLVMTVSQLTSDLNRLEVQEQELVELIMEKLRKQ